MENKPVRWGRLHRGVGPVISVAAVAAISVALWIGLQRQQDRQIRDATNLAATAAAREFTKSIEFRGRGLAALAQHWRASDLSLPSSHAEAEVYLTQYPYCELVAWIDKDQRVRWVESRPGITAEWLPQIIEAASQPTAAHPWVARSPLANKFVISTTAVNRGAPNGMLLAVFDASRYANLVLQNVNPNYQLRVAMDGQVLYDRKDATGRRERWAHTIASSEGADWVVTAWPGEAALARQISHLPAVVLVTGLVVAALLGAAVYLHRVSAHNEEAVQRANAYNRSLIEVSLDPLVTIGPDGKITDVNAATELATGRSRAELIGTDFSDYFTDPDKARAGYQQVFREGLVRDYPLELRHRDGPLMPVLYNASIYRDDKGGVIGVFAAARDVTEQKRAQEVVRRANAYNRSLIEASLDPLVTIGPDGQITDVNAATETATGHSRAELIGTDFSDYFTEPEKARAGYQQAFREGFVRDYPLELRHRDGRLTPVLYNASVYREDKGGIIGVFAAARDVTEQKRAHSELRRLNRALQTLSECDRALVHATDEPALLQEICNLIVGTGGYRFTWVGAAEHDETKSVRPVCFAGVEERYLQSANISWDDVPRGRGPTGTCVRTAKPRVNRFMADDPALALWRDAALARGYMSSIGLPLVRDGAAFGSLTIYSSVEDAFDQHEVELLAELADNLAFGIVALRERAARERATAELEKFAAELQRSNSELQDFASIASHDMQEPLRKITAFGERLRAHCAAQLDPTGVGYLERMENAAGRMSTLIERLLEYSRVTTKARAFEKVDLQATLFEVIADLDARIQSSGARVSATPMPCVEADRVQLREVLQNLIANGLKFHAPDAAPQVEIEARRVNGWHEIVIRDHGIGFDPRYLDRLFRPFQRLHGRTEFEGTGMGLAICRKIVARHGGAITAHSRLGEGSEFIVRLPAVRQPEGNVCLPAQLPDSASPSSSPKTMTTTTS